MLMILLYFASFAFWIWLLVKVGRDSFVMALLCFFLWPVSLVPLIRNWGQGDSDIRVPFLGALLCGVLAYWMAISTVNDMVNQQAAFLSDDDLAMIAEDDPEYADELRQLRDQALAEDDAEYADEDWRSDDDSAVEAKGDNVAASRANPKPSTPAWSAEEQARIAAKVGMRTTEHRAAAPQPQLISADTDLAQLEAEVRQLSYRLGKIKFERAHAELSLPSGFRFVPRLSLNRVARQRGTELEPHVLGWIVHQQVSLADPDGWYLEVLHVESGHLLLEQPLDTFAERASALSGQVLADGSQRSIGGGRHAPTWYALPGVLTWAVFGTTADLQSQAEVLAARLLRQGALLFVMHGVEAEREELALRATRLMAHQVEVAPGQDYVDFRNGRDQLAPQSLLAWVAGEP